MGGFQVVMHADARVDMSELHALCYVRAALL